MQQILEIGTYKQIQNVNYEIIELIGYGSQSLIYKVQNDKNLLVMKHMRNCDIGMIEIIEKLIKHQFRYVLNIIAYEACNKQPPYTDIFIISDLLQYSLENFKENNYEMLIQQSILGLGEIFDIGASHNDIKPDNIFFSLNKEKILNLKIGDFGLLSFEKQTKLEYYLQQGSIYYRAPEIQQYKDIVNLQQKQVNDIWGLGLTLFQVLTKENFYESNQKAQLIDKNYIDQRVSKLDQKFQPYISGCLNLDPSQRLSYFNEQYTQLVIEYSIVNQAIQKIKINLRREYKKPQPEIYHKILKYLDNQQIIEKKNVDQKDQIKELNKQIQHIIQEDFQEQFNKIVQQLNK
ncbi:hypothetical protein pb186bvf_003857 [Paramecium bursaria]